MAECADSAAGNAQSISPDGDASEPVPSPTLPWIPPTVQDILKSRDQLCTVEDRAQAWTDTADAVKSYSDELNKRWNAEIDTYLVYAGLFSAILTAFNVQSYQLLQPAPALDPVLVALQQISAQLSSFSTTPLFVNSTRPAYMQEDAPASPAPPAAVWLNTLWFSSLILSLSSASIGIMVKQWLNEYCSGISPSTSRETARLRQHRLNNLIKWRVGAIVMIIPILLQFALSLFLSGLLILLWTLHHAVASVASTLVFLLAVFTFGTILLPLASFGCAYLTPQTFVLNILRHRLAYSFNHIRFRLFEALANRVLRRNRYLSGRTWHWMRAFQDVLRKCAGTGPREFRTWRGRERGEARCHLEGPLDLSMLVMAYDVNMDRRTLHTVASCLAGMRPRHVIECFRMLDTVHHRHYSLRSPYATSSMVHPEATLWINTLISLADVEVGIRDARWDNARNAVAWYLPSHLITSNGLLRVGTSQAREQINALGAEWIVTAISSLAWNERKAFQPGDGMYRALAVMRSLLPCVASSTTDSAIRYAAATALRCLSEQTPCAEGSPDETDADTVVEALVAANILLYCVSRLSTEASEDSRKDLALLEPHTRLALVNLETRLRGMPWLYQGHGMKIGEETTKLIAMVAEHASLSVVLPPTFVSTLETARSVLP